MEIKESALKSNDDTATKPLSPAWLLQHVHILSREIGPRPAGGAQEARAAAYVRGALHQAGVADVEMQTFKAPNTWTYLLAMPLCGALVGNLLGRLNRVGRIAGGVLSSISAYYLWRATRGLDSPLLPLTPQGSSRNVIACIRPLGPIMRRVVLLGHLDSNKARISFRPSMVQSVPIFVALLQLGTLISGLLQVFAGLAPRRRMDRVADATALPLLGMEALLVADEATPYVAGANDNASAVAVLLGLGAWLVRDPLMHTEIWLAFTGAEESGCYGVKALLKEHGRTLWDAYFIDLELVGTGQLAFVTEHGLLPFSRYTPDPELAEIARWVAHGRPDLAVEGRPMAIIEEVSVLRKLGYKAICLAGYNPSTGWPPNWHQVSDVYENISGDVLNRAAEFTLEMIRAIDEAPLP
jgi:hypothetical protein